MSDEYIKWETERIRKELKEKYAFYSDVRTNVEIKDKTVIITDEVSLPGTLYLLQQSC